MYPSDPICIAHDSLARIMRTKPPYAAAFLCCLLLLVGGCSVKQAPAPYAQGQFVLPDGRGLRYGELAALAQKADYILVGETHDSKTDHLAQAALLRLVAGSGQRPSLGLEMLPHSRFSTPLREFSSGTISLDDLPEALEWKRSWGYDFTLYRPVFEAAGHYGIPIYGLNIEHDIRRAVSRKGLQGVSREEKKGLPSRIIEPLPEQKEDLAEFFLTHSAMLSRSKDRQAQDVNASGKGPPPRPSSSPRTGENEPMVLPVSVRGQKDGREAEMILPVSLQGPFERFLLVQSLWDSTMAEQAAAARKKGGGPLVVLAGGGHVAKGHGIAHRLAAFDPGARVLSVMPFSGERPEAEEADVFYYSPPQERPGYGITFAGGEGPPRIAAVDSGSRAANAGLKAGDVIMRADGKAVTTPLDLHKAAREAVSQGKNLTVTVEREGKERTVTLEKMP